VRTHRLEREQLLPYPVPRVFAFFAEARNLERLTPSWLSFQVLTSEPIAMGVGTLIDYRLRVHGLPLRWTSRIEEWAPGQAFIDRQVKGPYRLWSHRHRLEACDNGTVVRDVVDYALPLGWVGELAHPLFVARNLRRIFAFRHTSVERLLG
jgi:ligand-binding SRPBCC domain-containing protein